MDPEPKESRESVVSPDRRGLCPRCEHVKIVRSEKGSVFLLCLLAARDPRFAKYPPQPVVSCDGFAG
jgi:hypothetical protein